MYCPLDCSVGLPNWLPIGLPIGLLLDWHFVIPTLWHRVIPTLCHSDASHTNPYQADVWTDGWSDSQASKDF